MLTKKGGVRLQDGLYGRIDQSGRFTFGHLYWRLPTDLSKINTHIYQFYQHFYNEKQNASEDSIRNFLNYLAVPSLTKEQSLSCKENLIEKETYSSLIRIENDKSPRNDGLTKEFHCTFWADIKDTFMKLLKKSKQLKHLCAFQIQKIIKLLEKPNKIYF